MEIKEKELYLSPEVHIFEVKNEGAICTGSITGDRGDGIYGDPTDPWEIAL